MFLSVCLCLCLLVALRPNASENIASKSTIVLHTDKLENASMIRKIALTNTDTFAHMQMDRDTGIGRYAEIDSDTCALVGCDRLNKLYHNVENCFVPQSGFNEAL